MDDLAEENPTEQLQEPLNPNDEDMKPVKARPEDERLCGKPPLKTIFLLSIGPIISQLANSIFLIVNTFWVSMAIGDNGLAAISTYNAFDNIGRAFGSFLQIAAATQISALFGLGKSEEAGQVCADLLRMTLVCGSLVPAILLPSIKPCGRWFGATEDVVNLGWDYMLPLTAFTATTCMFMTVCGFLQGEGRTLLFGLANFGCLALNGLALDPLFLFGFKSGIKGVSIATIVSEIIPGLILFFVYYCGRFGVKPLWSQFCRKFSPRTTTALKVGLSQLIGQLSVTIPSILVRKLMGKAVGDEYEDALAGLNCSMRLTGVSMAVMNGITGGYVPAAAYAYAAKKYRRFLWLTFHSIWICMAWGLLVGIFMWTIPDKLAMMFSTSEGYMRYAVKLTVNSNILSPFQGVRFNCQTILQAMQMGGRATVTGMLNNFVWIILGAFLMYYTNKHDGARLVFAYVIAHGMSVPCTVIVLLKPMLQVWRLAKEEAEAEVVEGELEDVESKPNQDDGRIQSEISFNDGQAAPSGSTGSSSSDNEDKEKEVRALPEV